MRDPRQLHAHYHSQKLRGFCSSADGGDKALYINSSLLDGNFKEQDSHKKT
jgi:hypothetical protein